MGSSKCCYMWNKKKNVGKWKWSDVSYGSSRTFDHCTVDGSTSKIAPTRVLEILFCKDHEDVTSIYGWNKNLPTLEDCKGACNIFPKYYHNPKYVWTNESVSCEDGPTKILLTCVGFGQRRKMWETQKASFLVFRSDALQLHTKNFTATIK